VRGKMDREDRQAERLAMRLVPHLVEGKTTGFRVVNFDSDENPLRRAGIQTGDVLLEVNGVEMKSPGDAFKIFEFAKTGRDFTVQAQRDGKVLKFDIQAK